MGEFVLKTALIYGFGVPVAALSVFLAWATDEITCTQDDAVFYVIFWPVYVVRLTFLAVRWVVMAVSGAVYRKLMLPAVRRKPGRTLPKAESFETYEPGRWQS